MGLWEFVSLRPRTVCLGDTTARQMLRPRDELVAVNGVSLELLDHFDAWDLLKRLPDGPVYFKIRRRLSIS